MEQWTNFDDNLSYYFISGEGEYKKRFHLTVPSIVFPYNLTKIRIEVDTPSFYSGNLASNHLLIVPSNTPFEILNIDKKFDLAILHPQEKLANLVWTNCSITKEAQSRLFNNIREIRKEMWISEIIHRYIFEKKYAGIDENYVTRFLEIEIIKELYFCGKKNQSDHMNIFGYIHDTSEIPERLKKALIYIEQNIKKNITLKDICEYSNCSRSDLFRLFNKFLNSTPIKFMRERKIQEAYILLRNTDRNVNEVSGQLGINHTGHFIKCFRKKFGKTPKEFQNTISDIIINN